MTKAELIDLNELAKNMYDVAKKREQNGAFVKTDTPSLLKHCATEVVEAMEAYTKAVDCFKHNGVCLNSTFPSELADIIACVLIIAGIHRIDIERELNACYEKNKARAEGKGDKE